MKRAVKKLLAALLVVAMVCAMAIPAFAAAPTTGSITLSGAVSGHEYKIYRILDLETDDTVTAFKYKANGAWSGFITEHSSDFEVDADGYVTWINGNTADDSAAIQAVANAAGAYAAANGISPDATATAENATVSGLPLGYYLVVSDLTNDALCSLGTTAPNVTIREKNGAPSVDKEVEYAPGSNGKGNDGSVGDTVNFTTTIHVTDGDPIKYVLHDKMDKGLAFSGNVTVTVNGASFSSYTLTTDPADGCSFDVAFSDGSLKTNDTVVVKYSATITSDAVVGTAGNKNETWLDYGNNNHTTHDTTKTYTWSFNIFKFFKDGDAEKRLAGAEFVVYRLDNSGNPQYAQIVNDKLTGWTSEKSDATVLTSNDSTDIKIEGLDAGTYYVEETTAPSGYNKLTAPVEVTINSSSNSNDHATVDIAYKLTSSENSYVAENGVVKIENNAGTVLPGTGGMGTTLFYVVGGGLMLAAVVLLVTKKRMERKG